MVRRIGGLSLSVKEYWELDTWTTAKLLDMEKRIMDEEAKAYSKDSNEYIEQPDGNSEELNELVEEMSVEL